MHMQRIRWWAVVLVLMGAMSAPAAASVSSSVQDAGQTLNKGARKAIASRLTGIETATGVRVIVAVMPALTAGFVREYAEQIAIPAGFAAPSARMVLLVIKPESREAGLYISAALESQLPMHRVTRIVDRKVLPALRADGVEAAIARGIDEIELVLVAGGRTGQADAAPVPGCDTIRTCLLSFLDKPFSYPGHYFLAAVAAVFIAPLFLAGFYILRRTRSASKRKGGIVYDPVLGVPRVAEEEDDISVLKGVDIFPGTISEYEAFRNCRVSIIDTGEDVKFLHVDMEDDGISFPGDDFDDDTAYQIMKKNRLKAIVHARYDANGDLYGLPVALAG